MLIVVKYLSALKQLKNQDTVVPPTPTSTLFELNVTEFNVRLIDWRVGSEANTTPRFERVLNRQAFSSPILK